MKEIRTLMQQLRNYPSNSFAYSGRIFCDEEPGLPDEHEGLIVCDVEGNEQGFIELGGEKVIVL